MDSFKDIQHSLSIQRPGHVHQKMSIYTIWVQNYSTTARQKFIQALLQLWCILTKYWKNPTDLPGEDIAKWKHYWATIIESSSQYVAPDHQEQSMMKTTLLFLEVTLQSTALWTEIDRAISLVSWMVQLMWWSTISVIAGKNTIVKPYHSQHTYMKELIHFNAACDHDGYIRWHALHQYLGQWVANTAIQPNDKQWS